MIVMVLRAVLHIFCCCNRTLFILVMRASFVMSLYDDSYCLRCDSYLTSTHTRPLLVRRRETGKP